MRSKSRPLNRIAAVGGISILAVAVAAVLASGCAVKRGGGYYLPPPTTADSAGSRSVGAQSESVQPSYRPAFQRGSVSWRTSTPRRRAPSSSYGGGATGSTGSSISPPPAPSGGDSDGAKPSPPVTTVTPGVRRHIAPMPTLRPGLGTVFGERRYSVVRYVPFRRASGRPDAVASIHYNDYQGLSAMVRRLSRRCCGTLGARTISAGITVSVVNPSGSALRGAVVGDKAIVLGRHGERYALRIANNTARRYEIVASVDGLDVIDGRRANLRKRGYILRPYGTITIDGFRTSHSTVAAFRFGSVRNSYASRTGDDRNVGVIGVALFGETDPGPDEITRRLRARPFSYATPPPYRYRYRD